MRTITRSEFIDAIEAGIAEAGRDVTSDGRSGLTDEERMMLRHVGKTANRSARATFTTVLNDGSLCFCPLSTAGIWDGKGNKARAGHRKFYSGYDTATRPYFERDGSPYIGGFEIAD